MPIALLREASLHGCKRRNVKYDEIIHGHATAKPARPALTLLKWYCL